MVVTDQISSAPSSACLPSSPATRSSTSAPTAMPRAYPLKRLSFYCYPLSTPSPSEGGAAEWQVSSTAMPRAFESLRYRSPGSSCSRYENIWAEHEAEPCCLHSPSRRRDCHSAAAPPVNLVGVSIGMERGCRHNDRTFVDGCALAAVVDVGRYVLELPVDRVQRVHALPENTRRQAACQCLHAFRHAHVSCCFPGRAC